MFRQIRSFALVGVMIGVVVSCTVPALGLPRAFLQGERYVKETGDNAECLRKILYKWTINPATAGSDQFANCTVTRVGDYHRIECSGAGSGKDGVVANGETATITFSGTALDGAAEVVSTKWLTADTATPEDPCSKFISDAKSVAAVVPRETANRAGQDVHVEVEVENRHGVGTVEGSDIYYAAWQGFLHESDMTEVLWTCVNASNNPPAPGSRTECWDDSYCSGDYPYCGRYDEDKEGGAGGIDWYAPDGPTSFVLPAGGKATFDLGMIHKSRRVLFRFYTDATDNEYETDDYEVVHFWLLKMIPTVTAWGVVVMAMLLLTAGTIVYIRRRAVAARA